MSRYLAKEPFGVRVSGAKSTCTTPLGTAYAVWVGIGATGTTIYGIVALNESTTTLRLLCVLLIITGVDGLNLLHRASP